MVQVVNGDDATFVAMAYGRPSERTFQFLDNMRDKFNNNLTEHASNFYQSCQSLYRRIDNSEAMRLLKAAYGVMETFRLPDIIQTLSTIAEMQNAPNAMIPWVMANPVIREMYQNRQCAGYGDLYENMFGASIGMTHQDYRVATHGLWREVQGEMVCDIYADVSANPTLQLDIDEQLHITSTWIEMEDYLEKNRRDPTSRYNASL